MHLIYYSIEKYGWRNRGGYGEEIAKTNAFSTESGIQNSQDNQFIIKHQLHRRYVFIFNKTV